MQVSTHTTENKDICSLYWICADNHSDVSKEGYVGISMDAEFRWNQHGRGLHNPHLKNAIMKHGWDNLQKKVLLVSTRQYCLEIEQKLRPTENIGWNIAIGGGDPPRGFGVTFKPGHTPWLKGKSLPEHLKKRISEKLKGHSPPNKGKKGQVAWNKGIPMSAEAKVKLSAAKKGVKMSDLTRAKMSAAHMGKAPYEMTNEVRAKISATLKRRNLLKRQGVNDGIVDPQ